MLMIIRSLLILLLVSQATASSFYSDKNYSSLHEDKRNLSKGSIVTVLIYEQASASTSAGTNTERDTDLSFTGRINDNTELGEVDIGSGFKGKGTISRQGKLIASVSVTVQDVLDNGEMKIKGQQLIEFNNEKQHIKLEGRIRPEDVSAENTILSTRIADAHLTYVGDGLLGRQQKPGVLSRMFGWLF